MQLCHPAFWTLATHTTPHKRDQLRARRDDSYELLWDLLPEHVLATGITWEDFCRFFGRNKLVWIGPGVSG
jgi:hypothetical protein